MSETAPSLFKYSGDSSPCLSDQSSIKIKDEYGAMWSGSDRGNPKYWEKNSVTVPLGPPEISHVFGWDRTRASVARDRQISASIGSLKLSATDMNVRFVPH
jgi:hypothetical protein